MPFSTVINNAILDQFVGKVNTDFPPAAVYVGLSSTTPTAGGSNVTEPSGGSYARVLIPAASFTTASASANASSADIAFARATADWVSGANLTNAVFYTAISAGTFIGYKALGTAKPVLNGDTAKVLSGDFTMTVGGTA